MGAGTYWAFDWIDVDRYFPKQNFASPLSVQQRIEFTIRLSACGLHPIELKNGALYGGADPRRVGVE